MFRIWCAGNRLGLVHVGRLDIAKWLRSNLIRVKNALLVGLETIIDWKHMVSRIGYLTYTIISFFSRCIIRFSLQIGILVVVVVFCVGIVVSYAHS